MDASSFGLPNILALSTSARDEAYEAVSGFLEHALEVCKSAEKTVNSVFTLLDEKDEAFYKPLFSPKYFPVIQHICSHSSNELLRISEDGSYPEFSNDVIDAFVGEVEILSKNLETLADLIKEFQASKEKKNLIETYEFKRVGSTTDTDDFRKYLKIANYVKESGDLVPFEEKLKKLAKVTVKENDTTPFVFVCASSGTGKTNAAFALRNPFLYFLYYPDTSQKIYKSFNQESLQLQDDIEKDVKSYSGGVRLEDFLRHEVFSMKFRVIGLIIGFLERVFAGYYKSGGNKSFVEVQASINFFKYSAMSIIEARKKLKKIRKKYKIDADSFFSIIFDECAFTANPSSSEQDVNGNMVQERKFMFLRTIVRCIYFIPIFMGTNALAANFLGIHKGVGSGNSYKIPWCLVLHQLPRLSSIHLNNVIADILMKMEKWRMITKAKYPSEKCVLFLEKYLESERPLFLEFAAKYFEYFFEELLFVESDEKFLALLFEQIRDQFLERKRICDWGNRGQISYMAFHSWADGYLKKGECKTDLYINRHLGFLLATPDPEKNEEIINSFTTLTTIPESDGTYTRIYYYYGYQFSISSYFEDFFEKPLTGFICLGIDADNQAVMVSKDLTTMDKEKKRKSLKMNISGSKRVSLFYAIFQGFDKVNQNILHWSPFTSGFVLELTLYSAVILASRAEGFKGCNVKIFLKYLFRELDYCGIYGEGIKPPEIQLNDEFAKKFDNMRIPFLPPMAVEDWNKDFVKDLENLIGKKSMNLGLCFPSIKNSPADLVVKSWPQKKVVLAGECKLYKQNVDAGTLRSRVLNKFAQYPECRLFIAIAPDFSDARETLFGDFCVWIFRRNSSNVLEQDLFTSPQPLNSKKHVLLLELSELSSIKTNSRFVEIIESFHRA